MIRFRPFAVSGAFALAAVSMLLTGCGGKTPFAVDTACCAIVCGASNDPAAEELRVHLTLITGRDVPVVSPAETPAGAFLWYIGTPPAGESAVELKFEECRWRVSPSGAWFYGEGCNGARFAVYDFLENMLGVRWPSGTNVFYRASTRLVFPAGGVSGGWAPELKNREIRFSTRVGAVWAKRMRQGMHGYPRYGHAFPDWWNRFGKTHPEYFAMRPDGERLPVAKAEKSENSQVYTGRAAKKVAMCVSSSAFTDRVVAEWLVAGTNAFVNICENDASGNDVCFCPACRALDEPPPADMNPNWVTCYADRYVNFARRVSEKAKRYRPDARVCFYAYNPSEQPPRRERVPPDALVGLVPVVFSWDNLTNYVGRWKDAGLGEFFYRPNRHWHYRMRYLPIGNEEYFFRVWRFLYESGATGFDYDSPGNFGELEWFRDYVLAKAMQDPSKDFDYWENHYAEAFGAGAADVKAYFRHWREEVWNKRIEPDQEKLTFKSGFNVARGILRAIGTYYREEDFSRAGRYLARALERPDLVEPARGNVQRLVLANEHGRLLFRAAASKAPTDLAALRAFRLKYGFEIHLDEEEGIVDIPEE